MNRRGGVGQILTSFPSLVFVFVIMLLFVIISGVMSSPISTQDERFPESSPDAQALLWVFLGRPLRTGDIWVGEQDGDVSIESLLGHAALGNSNQEKVLEYIQKIFHERYSCDGKNVLKIIGFRRFEFTRKLTLIDYPLTFTNKRSYPLREESVSQLTEYVGLCEDHQFNSNSASRELALGESLRKDYAFCAYVEVNALC